MFVITFPDEAVEKKAIGFLFGRFSGIANINGEHIVPKAALGALASHNIPFAVLGKASDEKKLAALWSMDEYADDYNTAMFILHRPRMLYAPVNSLQTVLALIHGIALERHPPHGSGFLPGFGEFVNRRFHAGPHCHYLTLIEQFGHLAYYDGFEAVSSLLVEWKMLEDEQRRRESLTESHG
jgi:hypothetical protein